VRHYCRLLFVPAIVGILLADAATTTAHKPITSKYSYNEDVFPVLRDRCGSCHVDGGVAPMSLATYTDTLPWAESIRAELLAGHMPPWRVDGVPGKFRNMSMLTPYELDVLLTWVTGGTPIGDSTEPTPVRRPRTWKLGSPDLLLPLPQVALPQSFRDEVKEFSISTRTAETRWIRAVDLMPGTPSIVRSATISVARLSSGSTGDVGEQILALWQPGDDPIAFERGSAFLLPPASTLTVRIRYKKNWRDEQRTANDRSTVGLYFTSAPARELQSLTLAAPPETGWSLQKRLSFTRTVDQNLTAVAIYPDPALSAVKVRVDAVRPNGSREELIAFRPRSEWAKRYWFTEPIDLPRGTRIEIVAEPDDSLLAPEAPRIPAPLPDPAKLRLTLDVLVSKP
jgi:hypothetical protein